MTDQHGSGMATGQATGGGELSPLGADDPSGGPHHGRPVSWVAVGIMMAGFLVGGFGLILGPTWWLFWVGVGMVVVGGLLALATNIFNDWY